MRGLLLAWGGGRKPEPFARPNTRTARLLDTPASAPSQTPEDREARIQALLARLRPHGEQALRQMAERLADLPEGQAFGQVEYDLRELAHELAACCHQAGLRAGKKRG